VFPLGSKVGASSKEWGKLVLTLVATGRSAGVGEEGRRVLVCEEEEDGGAVTRMQRKQACSTTVGPAPPHGRLQSSWRTASPRAAFVPLPPFSPHSLPPPASVRCGQGMAPEAARVGNSRWSGGGPLIAAAGPARVDGQDAATGAPPHHDGAPARSGSARGL
jgi:hypothetical protein